MYYISLTVILLIFIWRIVSGFKKGLVQEIVSLIAMAIALVCLFLILSAVGNYMEEKIGKTIQMIVTLIVVCLIYRLISVIFTSFKLISKLPILHWADKLLGGVVGAAEAVLIVGFLVQIVKNWGLSILV